MKTQLKNLLRHLESGRKITMLDALKLYGIGSFHRRLSDLKYGLYDGKFHNIVGKWTTRGKKRFMVYELIDDF